jgi:hypothetical protein
MKTLAYSVALLTSLIFYSTCIFSESLKEDAKAFAQEWCKKHFEPLTTEERAVMLKYLKAEESCITEFNKQEATALAKVLRFLGIPAPAHYQQMKNFPNAMKVLKDFLQLPSLVTIKNSYDELQRTRNIYCAEHIQKKPTDKYYAVSEAEAAGNFIRACINTIEKHQRI